MTDDEFDDDGIDWAEVNLPSALMLPIENDYSTIAQHTDASQEAGQAANNASEATVATTTKPSIQSLQEQITHLQNLLQSKSERISELEATAQTELETRSRIHLVEEELRRVQREADQYKGQWVRQKKRMAELEQSKDDGRTITPNIDYFQNHFAEMKDSDMYVDGKTRTGTKRKSEEHDVSFDKERKEDPDSIIVTPQVSRHVSLRERVATHLLLRDEMGCYSFEGNIHQHTYSDLSSQKDSRNDRQGENEHEKSSKCKLVGQNNASQVADNQLLQETQSWVKSILYHMVVDSFASLTDNVNMSNAMSVPGLVRILLERFNTLFYETNEKDESIEMDVDQPSNHRTKERNITIAVHLNESRIKYTSRSWRSALYLLCILHDILSTSAKTRDDLRWWLYQACKNHDLSDHPDISVHKKFTDNQVNSRIEGLPTNARQTVFNRNCMEALWNIGSQTNSNDDNGWDASTMNVPCNVFYELLVGLMIGPRYIFHRSDSAIDEDESIAQYVQLKSIEFVSGLMSDAAELNNESKTPSLWKFWFDSLFPSYSSYGQISHSSDMEDLLTLWEKEGVDQQNMLGSGRRHYTQLLSSSVENEPIPTKQSGFKNSSKLDKAKTTAVSICQQDYQRLIVDIKCKSLHLITHCISSSSFLHQSIFKVHDHSKSGIPLAKRILFAVLDELDEFVIPFLSTNYSSGLDASNLGYCLDHCLSCVTFLLTLSCSNAGIHLLRIQSKLDFEIGEISCWSLSGIACVAAVLDSVLHHMAESENKAQTTSPKNIILIKAIVEHCVTFYKNILSYAHNQEHRSKSKSTSFLALITEERNTFVSCCNRVIAMQTLSEELKYDARLLLEEASDNV